MQRSSRLTLTTFGFGHSSGAHVAASCCAGLSRESADDILTAVKAAIVTSGMYQLEPVRRSYLNSDARLNEYDVSELSPATAASFLNIPIMVAVGEEESSEFIHQSEDFVRAIKTRGAMASFYCAPGTNHYTMLEQWRAGSGLLTRFQALLAARTSTGRGSHL